MWGLYLILLAKSVCLPSSYIHAQGISVDPKQTSLELSRVGVNVGEIKASEKLPYQFYCRREKSENR